MHLWLDRLADNNSPMLTPVKNQKQARNEGAFAIVASKYNLKYVDAMVRAAKKTLLKAGVNIRVVRVPGAYEIPVAAARLAARPKSASGKPELSAIICLGVILRGATTHAAHIGEAVSQALMQIQLRHHVPVVHEVLLLENHGQARERCLDPKHNRGIEAAQTALEMARVMQTLN